MIPGKLIRQIERSAYGLRRAGLSIGRAVFVLRHEMHCASCIKRSAVVIRRHGRRRSIESIKENGCNASRRASTVGRLPFVGVSTNRCRPAISILREGGLIEALNHSYLLPAGTGQVIVGRMGRSGFSSKIVINRDTAIKNL